MPIEYISVKEYANRNGLSERTVRNYCAVGRIEGAILVGKTWSIPADAVVMAKKRASTSNHLLKSLREQMEMGLKEGIYYHTQIDLTYNSNHIEGSRLTHDQTRFILETNTIGITDETVRVDDIMETVNLLLRLVSRGKSVGRCWIGYLGGRRKRNKSPYGLSLRPDTYSDIINIGLPPKEGDCPLAPTGGVDCFFTVGGVRYGFSPHFVLVSFNHGDTLCVSIFYFSGSMNGEDGNSDGAKLLMSHVSPIFSKVILKSRRCFSLNSSSLSFSDMFSVNSSNFFLVRKTV